MFAPFFEFSLPIQLGIFFLVTLNIVTFIFFGLDKFKASKDFRRIPERTLWLLCTLGGTVGALVGMYTFRHKTKKTTFQAVLFLILFVQIALLFFFLNLPASSEVNF